MVQSVRDVMTTRPVALPVMPAVVEAARARRDSDSGDIVVENGHICGIVTDR